MKLSKFLLFMACFTFFALLYVYQQSEIFHLAYLGQKRGSEFQDLLDKNTILRYNIESNASLVNLGVKISGANDYEMPATYRLVRLSNTSENSQSLRSVPKKENILARFFSIKREAQAKTINTSTSLSINGEQRRTINP